jgi:hypothetical protein
MMAAQAKTKKALTAKDFPDALIGRPTDPRCVCFFGWVCELHHDKTWEHDDCGEAGDPCPREDCRYYSD